ncbi:hypothetical protein [Streptomyces sp. NPDC006551]|uniref:hypothetical protein n=1 Tax=Streptomyces sp. NPDC006551 TaxID=3157178 RepID=UPI0033B8077E
MSQAWSVCVELDARDVADDTIDDLHERLIDASPAVGNAPNGNLSVRVFVDTATARQAIDTALKTVTAAARTQGISAPVVGVEVLTEAELDRRNAEPLIPELAGIGEIAEMFSVSRQRATQLSQRADFPPAVAHLKSGPVFVREQVEAFGRRWDRKGGRPPKPVDLSPGERDLLAALRVARNSLVHGDKRPPETILSAMGEAGAALAKEIRKLDVPDLATGVVLLAYETERGGMASALQKLRRERLIAVLEEGQQEGDAVAVSVELTAKGERIAAAH